MTSAEGATLALVRLARAIRADGLPAEALEVARHCVLDFVAVAVAGARERLSEVLVEQVVGNEPGAEATLIGRSERGSVGTAALVNGTAGHALDFDDAHLTMSGHPTVPVLPAVLALAEREGKSGAALLAGFVAGVELECRLAVLVGPKHYAIGFHSTGTLGTFGAAAACAHLLELGEEAWLDALGVAGATAAGLKASFGTMAKPLQAGRAAEAGLLAALLARGGFAANRAVVEAAQGFSVTHGGDERTGAAALEPYAGRFLVRDTLFKYHAACYLTHAAIEAARSLRERDRLEPKAVRSVEVRVDRSLLGVCAIPEPQTGLEGKFSLRATVAMALLGDDTGNTAIYTDARMADPALRALRDRVTVAPIDGAPPTSAELVVETENGRLVARHDTGTPAEDLLAQRARLEAKFRTLVAPLLGAARAEALREAALSIDRLPRVAELLRLARPEP